MGGKLGPAYPGTALRESPEKEALHHSPVIAELLLCTRQTPSDPFSAEALKPLAGQGGPQSTEEPT